MRYYYCRDSAAWIKTWAGKKMSMTGAWPVFKRARGRIGESIFLFLLFIRLVYSPDQPAYRHTRFGWQRENKSTSTSMERSYGSNAYSISTISTLTSSHSHCRTFIPAIIFVEWRIPDAFLWRANAWPQYFVQKTSGSHLNVSTHQTRTNIWTPKIETTPLQTGS